MTSQTHITMNELVELATLDAFGLLPAADAVKFEQAFMTASSEVQAEIRRIQSDLAADSTGLCDEEPSAALRQRVLDAVSQTIESEAERLAPLATIGSPFAAEPAHVVANTTETTGGFLASVWTWRMAALVMFGVVITLAVFNATSSREATMMATTYTTLNTFDELEAQFGPQFTEFIDNPNCRQYYLRAVDGEGMLRVAVNERTGAAFILGLDLNSEIESGRLQVVNHDGTTESIAMISTPNEGFIGQAVSGLDTTLFTTPNFEALQLVDADGTVLFRSA